MARLVPYQPPEWAADLTDIPRYRVQLARNDTPIHEWSPGGLPENVSLSIKRDDLTGSTLTGNKVRKLEFLLAEAMDKGCKHVVTTGSTESNHCRALALAARELGLTPHLWVYNLKTDGEKNFQGNGLLYQICGARVYLNKAVASEEELHALARKIESETGEMVHVVPVGGSNHVGVFGYIEMFEELRRQGALDRFDDVIVPFGSGGTVAGLAIGNYLTGCRFRIYGYTISGIRVGQLHDHLEEAFKAAGLPAVDCSGWVREVTDCLGLGYALSQPEELEFIIRTCTETGIALDPIYTGKAAYALIGKLQAGSPELKGRRILFVHTGGMFTLYDGRMVDVLKTPGAAWNTEWESCQL